MLRIGDWNADYIGKVISKYGQCFETAGLYRCNGWIACVRFIADTETCKAQYNQLCWFVNDKEHAKRMLGLSAFKGEEKHNALEAIKEWHLKPCKEAAELLPLLMKAYKDERFFVFYMDNDQSHERYIRDVEEEARTLRSIYGVEEAEAND